MVASHIAIKSLLCITHTHTNTKEKKKKSAHGVCVYLMQSERHMRQKQVRHVCTYQGHQGTLIADAFGCVFSTETQRAEFPWGSVKWIRVTTKYVKNVATSVLALKTIRTKPLPTRLFNSGKHYFYHFMDIVEAANQLQELRSAALEMEPTRRLRSPSCGGSGNDNPKLSSDTHSLNRTANLNRWGQAPNEGGNNNVTGTSTPFILRSKRIAMEDGDLSTRSPLMDGVLSPTSTGYVKRMNHHVREIAEDENNGRSSAGNGGGTNTFFVKVPRFQDQRECASTMFLMRHGCQAGSPFKRRHTKRCEIDTTLLPLNSDRGWGNLGNSFCRIFGTLCVVLLILLLLIPWVPNVGQLFELPRDDSVTRVIRGLEQMQRWRMERQKLTLNDDKQRDSPLMMNSLSSFPTHVTLMDMTVAVRELLARSVRLQQDLIFLRLHHIRRKHGALKFTLNTQHHMTDDLFVGALETIGHDVETRNEDAWFLEVKEQITQRGSLSARIMVNLRRLGSYIHKVFVSVRRIFRRRSSGGGRRNVNSNSEEDVTSTAAGKEPRTRYTEVLTNGQILEENVSVEDAQERRTCLRLTREMVRLSQILERVSVKYQDLIMAPLYESYLHQVPLNAMDVNEMSTLLGSGLNGGFKMRNVDEENGIRTGQNGHLLRSMLLRRHALALLHLEPLLHAEDDHYLKSVLEENQPHFTSFYKSSNEDDSDQNGSSRFEPTEENVEAILRDFVASTTHRRSSGSRLKKKGRSLLAFRNILPEVQYWREHEEEWQTILLWRLNASTSEARTGNMPENAFQKDDEVRNAIASLPLFHGSWCFLEQPLELSPKKMTAKREGRETETTQGVRAQINTASFSDLAFSADIHVSACALRAGEEHGAVEGANCSRNGNELFCPAHSQPHHNVALDADVLRTRANDLVSMCPALQEEEEGAVVSTKAKEEILKETMNPGIRAYELVSREVYLRWTSAFDLFLGVHKESRDEPTAKNGWWDRAGQYPTNGEGDFDGEKTMHMRKRFLRLLASAEDQYGRYMTADSTRFLKKSGAFFEFTHHCLDYQTYSWWSFFWPPSWFVSHDAMDPLSCWLQQMSLSDPVVCKLYSDVLQVPLGEMEDLSLMLLYSLSVPPELLKTHRDTRAAFRTACCVLFAAVVTTIVVVFVFPKDAPL